MNNKKYIKIEILFCSIILIILLLTFLFYLFFTFNKQSAENQEDTIIGQENNTDNNKKSDIKNESDIEVTEETLKKLIEKINFPTYAVASLYNVKSFDLKTIPNDLILRLGWSKIDFSKQNILQDNNQSNAHTLLIPAETLNDKVLNIFGGFINYTDSSFINGNVKTFNNSMFTSNNVDYHSNYYKENDLDNITYYTDFYTTLYMDNHTDLSPFIHQEFQKFTKSENKISVYVCTCFVDTEFYENSNDIYFNIYKDFNFDNNTFENFLVKTSKNNFINSFSEKNSIGTISLNTNSEISKIADKLNTYVYTFEFDNDIGEYFLTSFKQL